MQAVILAAGMGKRLGELTKNSTKCMVPIMGRRLIEHALDALKVAGIRRVVFVVGHGAEELKSFLDGCRTGLELKYVDNPIYDKSNNIYSLFLAREAMEADDSLLLESDILFEPAIIEDTLRHPAPNVAVVARFQSWMDGTVAQLDADGFVSCFLSKHKMDWTIAEAYYKTVNIYKLSRTFCKEKFFPFLDVYIRAQGLHEYYEEVLKVLTFVDPKSLSALDASDRMWYEIDDIQDLDIASALFSRDAAKLKAFHARYGGYWRFPALKDFCYLVNPFFPTPRMMQEMIRSYPTLVMNYPSGQRVQNLLGAKMTGCAPDQILVGNGASELIKALLRDNQDIVAQPVPTFEEYRACAGADRVRSYRPAPPSFRYGASELLDFCLREKAKVLILVNPDNPSGNFIPKEEVLGLAERLRDKGITFIYDESFGDFVDGSEAHSLLHPAVLEKFPNLAVVKSISKSYGVPGLRLGFLASSDKTLLEKAWKNLSIWNINSPAEHFLQIIDKYKSDFRSACKRIALEREHLLAELSGIRFLRPWPSKANYILCEVRPPWTPTRLAETLLNDAWLFIKDCGGKIGFEKTPSIRLTVRDRQDNEALLAALRALKR